MPSPRVTPVASSRDKRSHFSFSIVDILKAYGSRLPHDFNLFIYMCVRCNSVHWTSKRTERKGGIPASYSKPHKMRGKDPIMLQRWSGLSLFIGYLKPPTNLGLNISACQYCLQVYFKSFLFITRLLSLHFKILLSLGALHL